MKPHRLVPALLLAAVGSVGAVVVRGKQAADLSHSSASSSTVASGFGPKHCVLIERSAGGSCVIRTDCSGQDTSKLEYAFDCWSASGDIFRHSYGLGGFADREEFDTEVKCAQCHAPSENVAKPPSKVSLAKTQAAQHPLLPNLAPAARAAAAIKATEKKNNATATKVPRVAGGMGDLASRRDVATPGPEVSRYGPKNCVATWRNTLGHCMVQTTCQEVDISSYEFGLICIDSKGVKTRHVFGRGSFDASESFDTLADCDKCIGLDDQRAVAFRAQKRRWQQSEESNEVATLSAEVQTLTKGMTSMLSAVLKLRQNVEAKQKPTPSPAAVATLAAWSGEEASDSNAVSSAPEEKAATVSVAKPRLRTSAVAQAQPVAQVQKKHHHRKRRVVEYDDDDEEDGDGDDEQSAEQETKTSEDDREDDRGDSDEGKHVGGWPSTNGIGETLGEDSDAEASELSVAEDGVESAGALDDGSSTIDAAW